MPGWSTIFRATWRTALRATIARQRSVSSSACSTVDAAAARVTTGAGDTTGAEAREGFIFPILMRDKGEVRDGDASDR
jgi:hypothetical protein